MPHALLQRLRVTVRDISGPRGPLERARRFCGIGAWRIARKASTTAGVVLLVQPERHDRDTYAASLRVHGFAAIPISTAGAALTRAPRVDVVVTDILLPGPQDGIAFVMRLKTSAETRHLPVIVLTACAWARDRQQAEQAGCDVFLPKPCVRDDLLREVRRLVSLNDAARATVALPSQRTRATSSASEGRL